MKGFSASTEIRAPAETVWALLTDADSYASWNPTIEKVSGKIVLGGQITLVTKAAAGRAFPLKVVAFERPRRMVWTGGMPLGLFTGERVFTLTPKGEGVVEFSMRETFGGLLAPVMIRLMPDLQPDFEEFARALKRRAEGAA